MLNITSIINRHESLQHLIYSRFLELNKSPAAKQSFVDDVYALLKDIRYQYTMSDDPGRYLLYNIAQTWRVNLETMLGVPAADDCLPLPPPHSLPSTDLFTEEQLTSHIRALAKMISGDRANRYAHMVADANRDWHEAEVYLANDVLVGNVRFDRLRPESYWRLENIWLSEIVQIRAYHRWEKEGRHIDTIDDKADYLAECAACTQLLVNPALKARREGFAALKEYLLTRYIEGSIVDMQGDGVRLLIEGKINKARQAGNVVDSAIYSYVREYVTAYYNNIIAAVEQANKGAIESVISAFGRYSMSSILNAFEVAVVIYFVDGESIQQFWREPRETTCWS